MANLNRNFTELDFEKTKQNIIDFLSQKTEFQDFNFEGSAMSILLDSLAYATTYMAVHANLSISECFLDSAQLRGSVVSRAKELGYTPRSRSASQATVELTVTHPLGTSGLTDIVLPRGTRFIASADEVTLSFVTTEQVTLLEERDSDNQIVNPGVYKAQITIYEGQFRNESFEFIEDSLNTRFRLNSKEIDTRFLRVTTKQNESSTSLTNWNRSTDFVTVGPETQVYFLQEGIDGFFEIYFGDNIIGLKPDASNIVEVEYLVTSGTNGNGVGNFALADNIVRNPVDSVSEIFTDEDISIQVVETSRNGSERESIDEIKNAAPKVYKAQRRAVTREDYVAIIQNEFGFVDTISAWGGEDNVPPAFGQVFVSIKPKSGETLSPITKQQVLDILTERYSIIGVIPKLVDPEFTFVRVTTNVAYRKRDTTLLDGEMINRIRSAAQEFFTNNTSFFNGSFRYSRFVRAIDEVDASIDGNETFLKLAKKFRPTPGVRQNIVLDCANEILPNTVRSEGFLNGIQNNTSIRDNGNGRLDFFVNEVITQIGIGEVDYTNGIIQINNFAFDTTPNQEITIITEPKKQDLFTERNNLIVLDSTTVNLINLGIES